MTDEVSKGMWSSIGQPNRDTVGKDDFNGGISTFDNLDRNEDRFGNFWLSMFMFLKPSVERGDGTANFTGDLSSGGLAGEHTPNGLLLYLATVTNTGHEGLRG
jgi:hypothetical protein